MICVKEENGKSALNKEQLTIQDSAWLTEQEESEDVRQIFFIEMLVCFLTEKCKKKKKWEQC